MIDIKIKHLAAEDVDAYRSIRLMALSQAPDMFGAIYAVEVEQPLQFFIDRLTQSFILGAYQGEQIVGIVVFQQQRGMKVAHKAQLYSFFVHPEFRGLGIADQLLKAVIVHAKQCVSQILLTVLETNHAALRLYQKHGFKEYGVEPRAVKNGAEYQNEVLMVLLDL
ncbi:ribosomal protein S18 acetylase RimI-like enzyme [Acinetobacter calcoaceticus]|uniref:Ribosomal protein S18 acetylase RimI-like enzyme n=1 Tax=Acinetobacter calcoaceticus TaxID=471 RepID=A0A4R1YA50_ACICA|nr:ribosomal protein S18 acetylase RimI-like enzyme [Acinetobacter calcoaceticus]